MYASSFFREVYSVEFVQIVGAWSVSLSSTHLGSHAQWCASEKELCLFLRDGVQRLRDSEYELSRYFEVQPSPDFENELWRKFSKSSGFSSMDEACSILSHPDLSECKLY